jgi:GMP synthase (glutamine-hydrolysing)
MRVLIVDNNIEPASWGASDLRAQAARTPGANVYVRRAPDADLPRDLSRFDRFVISGSLTSAKAQAPWINQLEAAIRAMLDSGKPVLGVCYGHQMIARVLGGIGAVGKGEAPEFGWSEIERVAPARLFEGLPEKFFSYSSHFEEVTKLPSELKCVARSAACGVQAYEMPGKPVFGIQFHPEKDLEGAERSLIERKKKGIPKQLLRAGESRRLFDANVGETIFRNFFTL